MNRSATPFWRDDRFWRIATQVVFLVLLVLAAWFLSRNMLRNLNQLGTPITFDFLRSNAGFDIGESVIEYDSGSSFAMAFLVGVLNTLKVAVVGIILATLLGFGVGVARLSTNWLVNRLAAAYVELLRNTPVLLQILFWYSAVFLKLPRLSQQIVLPGPIYLSNRGLAMPWLQSAATINWFLAATLVSAIVAWVIYRRRTRIMLETGERTRPGLWALAILALPPALSWVLLPTPPMTVTIPIFQGSLVNGGIQLSPEFAAVLFGLVVYTSAYIGEIVRAGVQAVSRGQVEAARALGLNSWQVLRLVILPQALRVIIPPLTSQFLNLTKNSSLAIAAGYPDLFSIATTIMNQTGRFIEMLVIIMLTYLSFSLFTSLLMNMYNRSVRLVER